MGMNPQSDLVVDYILHCDADFIVLQELTPQWKESLQAELEESWPFQKTVPRSDNFGIALYSKIPWESCEVVEFGSRLPTPSVVAHFQMHEGTKLRLIGTHAMPPMTHRRWLARNSLFEALAIDVRKMDSDRTIVAGDLNCTPWSYWFRTARPITVRFEV